jgi:hypothetical protein
MGAVEKLFSLGGIDMAAAVKAAGDGIANLNAHLARSNENIAAVGARLDAIDMRQGEILASLTWIVTRLSQQPPERPQ